jgi:hypothetical protein
MDKGDQINVSDIAEGTVMTTYEVQDFMLPKQENENIQKVKLNPMSPLAAAATVVNLLLATGPFTYPYGYVSLGPVVAAPLLFITCFLAYITATYMVEAISIA